MKKTIIALAVALLGGCASEPPNTFSANDATQVSQNVVVEFDEFKKVTTYTGPSLKYNLSPNGRENEDLGHAYLFGIKSKDGVGKMYYSIGFSDGYYAGDWRKYDQAYDSDGNRFKLTVADRKVDYCSGSNSCRYIEAVSFSVTEDYLITHTQQGAKFKVAGSGGEVIFIVSGPYIEGFLKAAKN